MKSEYQIATVLDSSKLTEFLVKDGQFLLPMMQLIVEGKAALDDFINVVGKASIQAVLVLSAMEVAGDKHKGKSGGDIRWHGQQKGVVPLKERKMLGKPHPDIYLLAVRAGTNPVAECLAIEDSVGGVQAARAAGLAVVGVHDPDAGSAADLHCADLADLLGRLRRQRGPS